MKQKQKPLPRPDPYSRVQDMRLTLPYQFLLLCKLLGLPPQKVLTNFMVDAGCERISPPGVRVSAMDYFIRCGYGQDFYKPEDIRQMLWELEAISMLCSDEGSVEQIREHARWRDHQHAYWYKKWHGKIRRKQ